MKKLFETLSDRECQILKFAAKGYTSKEIGNRLYIEQNTVETHRKNILKKTRTRSITQVVGLAFKYRVLV